MYSIKILNLPKNSLNKGSEKYIFSNYKCGSKIPNNKKKRWIHKQEKLGSQSQPTQNLIKNTFLNTIILNYLQLKLNNRLMQNMA